MFRKYPVLWSSLLFILLFSCQRRKELPEMIDAYHLRYEIEYLEEKAGDIPTRILPGTMDAYYSRYFVLTKIEGFFNQFSLVQVADLKHRRVTTMLNFFGNKVFYAGETGELPAGVARPERLKCRRTGDYEVIGGLRSERMEVEKGDEQFNIYCTQDFSVRRPNISTPYSMVDDPLTDFRIQLSVLKMHLRCSGMVYGSIETKMFDIPEDYRPVDRASMEEIINSLFTKD